MVCLTFHTSNRGQKKTSWIPVCTSFHSGNKTSFSNAVFSIRWGGKTTTVIFYKDFSSLLTVLTMTSTHSSCLSQLPSSLRLFISPEWRSVDSSMNKQTQTHTLRQKDIVFWTDIKCYFIVTFSLFFGYFLPALYLKKSSVLELHSDYSNSAHLLSQMPG